MKEYDIVTQGQFHAQLPDGKESDWVEFAQLQVVSGKLRVSDPMVFRDLPPSPTFEVVRGTYRVFAKTMTYPNDRRVSRLRAVIGYSATIGPRLDDVGVDFAQVGMFDPVALDAAAEKMDDAQGERFLAELDRVAEFGVAHLGEDERAVMAVARSGFGDGGYPIHELLSDGSRVGLEVVFIGPEVTAA